MHEEHNSVLSTPAEADKIGYYGRYRYIGKTQISAKPKYRPIYRTISSDNVVADAHSRVEIEHAAQLDWIDFAKAQQNDYVLKRYLEGTNSVNVITQEWRSVKLLCDVSRDGVPCPLVPCRFRRIIFDNCHNLTDSGIRVTISFISETYT